MASLSVKTRDRTRQPLYAIPDCDAVLETHPNGFRRHLKTGAAADRIRTSAGLAPVAIDPAGEGRIFWADMGHYPLRESKHLFSFKRLVDEGRIGETFTSDMTLLDDQSLFADGLLPAGLIFHISRCGSTLATKALSRPEGNVMVSQGGPLQRGFWANLTDDWRKPPTADARSLTRLRSLIFALTRPRLGTERRAFVKFISWNILYLDVIRKAFPGSPALFLYRNPAEVIATIKTETTAALLARGTRQAAFISGHPMAETHEMGDTSYLASCYANYLRKVLFGESDIACVNYRDLCADNFRRIVNIGLDYMADEHELALMESQFAYDSKDDARMPRNYSPAQEAPLSLLTPEEREQIDRKCGRLLLQLDQSARNVFAGASESRLAGVREASV